MTKENKNKFKAIVGTIMYHIALLLLLLFLALRTPLPLPGEEGVYVNLGFSETGMDIDQQAEPAPAEKVITPPIPEPEVKEKEYITQNIEEAPAIKEKKPEIVKKKEPEKVKPEPKPEPVKEVVKEPEPEPEPKPNPKAMYKGSNNSSTKGGQEGQTGQPGDQGVANGTPNAPTYKGTPGAGNGTGVGAGTGTGPGDGSGDGISYSLGGRGSLSLHKPAYDSKEQGKVVVAIKVDRKGNVISAAPGAKGTNVSDQTLWQLAKSAALLSTFKEDPEALEPQVGTITYNFIRQN
jgi:outer membrane biosynthesis protein TonB